MYFELVGEIADVRTIAVGRAIPDLARMRKRYGTGRWRKLKGTARVRPPDGRTRRAELPWYETHGVRRVRMKSKRFIDEWRQREQRSGFCSVSGTRNARTSSCESSTNSCRMPAPPRMALSGSSMSREMATILDAHRLGLIVAQTIGDAACRRLHVG